MTRQQKRYAASSALLFLGIASGIVALPRINQARTITVRGAVIRGIDDPNRRSPIAGVKVSASADNSVLASTTTDTSGAFSITIRRAFLLRNTVVLHFSHADYKPYDIYDPSNAKLYVAMLEPLHDTALPPPSTTAQPGRARRRSS